MLVHLLRSRGDLLVHGEVFLRDGVGALQGDHRKKMIESSEYREYLNRIMFQEPSLFINRILFDENESLAVGFKFKTDESLDPFWRKQLDAIILDKEVFIINLRRRDLLAQFASYIAVNRLGMPTLIRKDIERPHLEQFSIEKSELQDFCESVIEREKASYLHFKDHRILDLWYEDIVDPNHESLTRVQQSLGLVPRNLGHGTARNIPNLKSVVSNYDQISKWYLNTDFSER
jgi:hypothetical protein